MFRIFAWLLVAALQLGAVFPARADDTANADTKVKVGMILPLAGDFAAVGADGRRGIELAMHEHSGEGKAATFTLLYGDSRGDPTTAVGEFRKLVDVDQVAAVYAFRGPVGMALSPIAKQAKLPILGGVGNKAFAARNSYAFQIWTTSDAEGSFLAAEMLKRGHRSVALATSEDDWTASVSETFREAYQGSGGKLLTDQSLSAKDGDFRTLVTQIAKAAPDAVFVNVTIAQIGPFLRQLREQGVKASIYSNFWCAKKDVLSVAGEAAEGLLFAEMSLAGMPKFREAIAAQGGGNPTGATLSGYVATKLLLQAADSLTTDRSAAALYQALLAQNAVKLADMDLAIRERKVEFPMTMNAIRAGKVVPEN